MIYVSNGDSNSDSAQDPQSHRGKILRLRDDGCPITRSPAAPDTSPRSIRRDIATRWGSSCIRSRGRFGITRTAPMAAMKSTSSCRAETTDGLRSAMGAGTKGLGFQKFRGQGF
jgi:hypothetical protein